MIHRNPLLEENIAEQFILNQLISTHGYWMKQTTVLSRKCLVFQQVPNRENEEVL